MAMTRLILALAALLFAIDSHAASNQYPTIEAAPALTTYVNGGTFAHTYYIATTGNDTTGDGSIGNPWATVNGARTGGAGTAAVAGDLIYFRGGTYTATEHATSWKNGYYYFNADGTSSNRIVFTAYPGETPIFAADGNAHIAINIRGDYVVIDSLTFSSGSLTFYGASYYTVQNCTFDGDPYDPWNDQINDTHLGINDNSDYGVIRNNYFKSGNAHAIKEYQSTDRINGMTISYNRFYSISVSYGAVAFKGAVADIDIYNNRFEDINIAISWGTNYDDGNHTITGIHHNAFDNVAYVLHHVNSSTQNLEGLDFYSNIVLNDAGTNVLYYMCDGGCYNSPTTAMGDFYDNVFYGVADLIEPNATSDLTLNYPAFWNYNATTSTAIRDTAENANSLAASSWNGSARVIVDHGITRTGDAGNRWYTVADDSQFKSAGRYGGNIGGWSWDNNAVTLGSGGSMTLGSGGTITLQ